jgi:hypothetical protein
MSNQAPNRPPPEFPNRGRFETVRYNLSTLPEPSPSLTTKKIALPFSKTTV